MSGARCATYFTGVVAVLTAGLAFFSKNTPTPPSNSTSTIVAPTVSLLPTATAIVLAETITVTGSPSAFAPSSASVPPAASAISNAKVRFNGLMMPRMSSMDQRRYQVAMTLVMVFGTMLMLFYAPRPRLQKYEATKSASDQLNRLLIDRFRAAFSPPALEFSEVVTCYEYQPSRQADTAPVSVSPTPAPPATPAPKLSAVVTCYEQQPSSPVDVAPASIPPVPRRAAAALPPAVSVTISPPPEDSSAVIASFTSALPRVALPRVAVPPVHLPPSVAPPVNCPVFNAAAPAFNPLNPPSGLPRFAGGRGRTENPEGESRRLEQLAIRSWAQYAAFQAQHPRHGQRHQ